MDKTYLITLEKALYKIQLTKIIPVKLKILKIYMSKYKIKIYK